MCGIAGVSLADGSKPEAGLLAALSKALVHRGPDGKGSYVSAGVGLVHRRLSIIDVAGGAQPLSSHGGELQLVANGEIYNYKDLQNRARSSGMVFKTNSDCETLLWLYDRYGIDFTQHINGMYALALYDKAARRLVLARDPFGIKPLYYTQTAEGFAFASEPAALMATGWVKPGLNEALVPAFLNRQYAGGEACLWAGVKRLNPGEVLVVERGKVVSSQVYAAPLGRVDESLTTATALARLDEALEASTWRHLQTDVPYGAFLSGGIDSTSMLSSMQRVLAAGGEPPARTYTLGFADDSVADERAVAKQLAAQVGALHTEVSFDEQDFWGYLPQLVKAVDDPIADYAALPMLKLAAQARGDVKVILSGEGGDEIFAGYGRYRLGWLAKMRGKEFRGRGSASGCGWLDGSISNWPGEALLTTPGLTDLQQRQAWDIADWLPDNLLVKADRCLMTYGIEGRVPMLDLELAKLGFSLPDRLKVRGKHGKWLLKHWLETQQPNHPVWQKKRGFTVPIAAWLNGRQRQVVDYLAGQELFASMADINAFAAASTAPWQGKSAKLAFNLLVLCGWYEQHMLGVRPYAGLIAPADVK